ncbi:MAG: DUF1801 domain-containing protein [Patescibacteria group bacterium]
MAEIKTKKTDVNPLDFINTVEDEKKREDSKKLLKIFKDATGMSPKMWGTSIIGYGQYHYKSERSSQEGDWPLVGFSPRKQNLTLYIMTGLKDYQDLLNKIGPHKTSTGSCLYIKRLSDIDQAVLTEMIKRCVKEMQKRYPTASK